MVRVPRQHRASRLSLPGLKVIVPANWQNDTELGVRGIPVIDGKQDGLDPNSSRGSEELYVLWPLAPTIGGITVDQYNRLSFAITHLGVARNLPIFVIDVDHLDDIPIVGGLRHCQHAVGDWSDQLRIVTAAGHSIRLDNRCFCGNRIFATPDFRVSVVREHREVMPIFQDVQNSSLVVERRIAIRHETGPS